MYIRILPDLIYYFDIIQNNSQVLNPALMITLPDNLIGSFPSPNFGKMLTSEFIGHTMSITLVAVIESLLSIKAVDKLDPLKRRSNINKDLRALGIATGVSGFFGGLNVVTVIARSSVNVNNGANNRSANFFHAAFLLVFILVFSKPVFYLNIHGIELVGGAPFELQHLGEWFCAYGRVSAVWKIGSFGIWESGRPYARIS